jgi:DNA-binding GntR family transcriptional regulator
MGTAKASSGVAADRRRFVVRSLAVQSVVDALAAALRDRIFEERLPGGTVLAETEVAREYSVSRPTAKTAIERLVAEGLLHRGPHKSARVPVLTADEIGDLYFARSCLEAESVRRLAATSTVPFGAREAAAELASTQAAGPARVSELVEPDIRFHRSLVDALGSERLTRAHAALMAETRLCMAQVQTHDLLPPVDIVAEHQAILDYLAAGDPASAAAAIVAHLDRARVLLHGSDPSPRHE